MKKILFVCTGNTCRSPMAELYFNDCCRKAGISGLSACSAGICAGNGGTLSPAARAVMESFQIQGCNAFRTTRFSPELAEECDLLVGMTLAHKALMLHFAPQCSGKVRTLLESGDVPDPYGGTPEHYRQVFEAMRPALDRIFQQCISNSTNIQTTHKE